jgi:hypothetical protein
MAQLAALRFLQCCSASIDAPAAQRALKLTKELLSCLRLRRELLLDSFAAFCEPAPRVKCEVHLTCENSHLSARSSRCCSTFYSRS